MRHRFHDSGLSFLSDIARRHNVTMDDKDDKTKDEVSALINDIKGIVTTAKDGATAVSALNDHLIKDNFRLREARRNLTSELTTAKKLPDGAKLLLKEDAEAYDKYKALGFKPEDLSVMVVDYDNLRVGQVARDAGEALGWKHPVLKKLIESQGLDIEMKDVDVEEEQDGKKVKVKKPRPFVTTDDNKSVALDEYEPLKDFHASLIMDEEGAGAAGRTTQGVRMPAQTGSTASNGSRKKGAEITQTVASVLDSRYKRPEKQATKK